MMENSDKIWFVGEGNGKPLQYSSLENSMNSIECLAMSRDIFGIIKGQEQGGDTFSR